MKAKPPTQTSKRAAKVAAKPVITITGVRQEALENFAGSLAQVTAIANGICHIALKERCEKCGHSPQKQDPQDVLKLVPRPSEITGANALLAKISLPAQTEEMGDAEAKTLIAGTLHRYLELAVAYGVPREIASQWHAETMRPLLRTA